MTDLSRRSLVKTSLATLALAGVATGTAAPASATPSAIPLVRKRLTLPTGGIATGDVTTDSAVLWSRASGPGRLSAQLQAVDAPVRSFADATVSAGPSADLWPRTPATSPPKSMPRAFPQAHVSRWN